MEQKREIKQYKIDMICRCNHGVMVPDGFTLLLNPPLYQHTCDYCGHSEKYEYQYPRFTTEYK